LIAVYKKNLLFYLLYFLHTFVPCGRRIHGGSRPRSQNLQRRRRYFCPHKRLVKSVKEDIKRADVQVENCLVSASECTKNRLAAGLRQKLLAELTVLFQAL